MKDLQYNQEVNKQSIESLAAEKRKLMEEINSAVKIEMERLQILHKAELEQKK